MMHKRRKQTRLKTWAPLMLITMLTFMLVLFGCGGGGGDGSSTSGPEDQSDVSGDSGTVALYLADAPADDFDHIWIDVSEITLIPCDEDGEPQVIFQSDEPQRIDLLELRDDNDLLLAIEGGVATGEYCQIRLQVAAVEGDTGDETIAFNLPSDRIDFNPQGSFQVEADETLSIRIDIDAEQSIHISGPDYNFRPVVFVDFDEIDEPRPCRHLLRGQIAELIYATPEQTDEEEVSEEEVSEEEVSEEEASEEEASEEEVSEEETSETDETDASETVNGDIIGFRLDMHFGFSSVDVLLQEDTVIFDEEGNSAGIDALAVDQVVGVKGRLDSEGRFLAELVVIGSVVKVFGTAETAVDESNTFKLKTAGFSPLYGEEAIDVSLTDDTSIMMGDTQVDNTQIQPNQQLKVVGKYNTDSETLNAIAIFIKPSERIGVLTAMEAVQGGSLLTIKVDPMMEPETETESEVAEEISVLLPEGVVPRLTGVGDLSLEELVALITCDPPLVRVILSQEPTEDAPAEAMALDVLPLMLEEVTVESITDGVITTSDGDTIQVPEDADIWSHTFRCQAPYLTEEIQAGDTLMVSAIKTCEPTDYHAVLIIKVGPFDPSEMPCFPRHDMLELKVAQVDEAAITGEDGTIVTITEDTRFLSHTLDLAQWPPAEFSLEDIEVGNTLVCHVRIPCETEENVAVLIMRVDPDADGVPGDDDVIPPDGDVIPPDGSLVRIEGVIIETVANGVITTTEGEVILFSEDTFILRETEDDIERVESSELAPGQQLDVNGTTLCEYEEAEECVAADVIVITDADPEA